MKMKYSKDPELRDIQKEVHANLNSIFGSEGQEMQKFVRNVFQYLKDRDPNKPVWGESVLGRQLSLVLEAALDKGGLFNLIIKNLGAVLNLLALFLTKYRREKFNEAMSDKDFVKSLSEDEGIKSFVEAFDGDMKKELSDEERIAKIQNVINILVNIPERDDKSFLDREFIKSVFELIQNNKDKLNLEGTKEIVQLVVAGQFIDPTNTKAKQKNTFAVAKAAIKLIKEFKGLGDPIDVKKSQISKLIVGAISKNAPGIINDAAFERVLEQVATEEGMQVVLDKAEKIIDALDRDEPTYSLVVGHVIDLLGGELYEGVKEVLNDPNLILSQCFEVASQKENGEVVYKLSALGKTLVSKDLIKVNPEVADVEVWAVTFKGTPEFSVQDKKNFLGVKITKENFESQVLTGFDVTALRDISQGLFAKKETVQEVGHVMRDLGDGMPIFAWLSKALKMVKGNRDLTEKLSLHHGLLKELATKFTPADLLSNFGLEKSFLGIIKPLLKDQKTVESIERIVTQLGSENSSQMTHEAVKLLNENPELAEFLQEPEMREQLASLVDKLSGSIEMMREYLSRTEFTPLKEELKPSLNRLLDNALKLATGNLLEPLDLNMGCSQLVNGLMFGERVSNIQDRVRADAAAKELYLILAGNSGVVPAVLTADQLAKIAPLGIENVEQLQAELIQGQINMAGYELYNQVNFVFKADFPSDQIASKQELIAKIAAERDLALEILSAGGDVDSSDIAPERALMFKQVFQTYNDKVAGFEGGTEKLCARFKHEIQMRKLESALMACNSEAIFSLVSRDVAAADMTEEQLKGFIRDKSFLPEAVATILMNGKASISTDELKSQLSDIGCRKRGGEGVGDIQLMLGDVLAPFSSILQMPYSVSAEKLESLEDQLGAGESFTRDQIKAFLNEKLENPADIEVITSQLIVGEDPIIRAALLENLTRVAFEQEQAEKDKVAVIPALNKLLNRIPQNPTMLQAVKRVIDEKGTPESQSDVIVEAIGEIFTTDLYSADEKKLLANKVVKPVLRQMQMPVSVINAIEAVVDKALASKESARGLYNNGQIKDILKKILTQEFGSLVWSNFTSSLSALWNLGVSSSVAIGRQFTWNVDVKKDPFIIEKFKAHLDMARADAAEGQKVRIQSILRRYFRESGLYTFSGQNLEGIDFSQTIISNEVFEQTNFGGANFANAEFVKCAFNKCTITQDLNLTGSKFDLKSFQSFVESAEAKKLDINELLVGGVTVFSNGVPQGMDARLVYGLMQYCKAKNVPFSQNVLVNAVKEGKIFKDFYLFSGEGLQAMQKSIDGVSVLSLYETGKFSGLNADQSREVIRLLNFSARSISADKLDELLLFLKSPQYANISEIASALGADNNTRIKIYADLQDVDAPGLEGIKASLAEFKPSSDLKDLRDESVSTLLKQWYLNRASGRMIPEVSRNTDSKTASLFTKAVSLREDKVVDDVTKAIASKLLNDRFLKYSDRMHDLERIHAAIKRLVDDLSPEYKEKLGESDMTKLANDACALINPHTKYEILSPGKLYIESGVKIETIKGWLSSRFSKESIAVNDIISRAPSLESYKAELLAMPLDSLEVISDNPELFAARSAIDTIPGMLYASEDRRTHDQMYELDADSLRQLLGASDEIFEKIKDYSKKSDIPLSEMVKRIDVLNNLKLLSDELVERYKLAGNTTADKLCLNLAAKVYTDSAEVKALTGNESGRTMLANVFFVELQKLERDIPPVDLTKLEVCSRSLCEKLGAGHTLELATASMAQGRTIAQGIFEKLGIADVWQNPEKTEKSINNLAAILGSKIFESGRLIDERNLPSVIGEKRPAVGLGRFTGDQSTGLVKAYQSIYYTSMSVRDPWYEVGKFDKKDDHTMRLLESFDNTLIKVQDMAL